MHPVLFELRLPGGGTLTIAWFGLLTAAGAVAALLVARWLLVRERLLTPRQVADLVLLAGLAALVGAKLVFLLTPAGRTAGVRSLGVLYGAIFGGIVALVALARRHGLPPLRVLDASAAPGVLPPLFGRLGCFMAGCCYGRPTDAPWGVVFDDPRALAPHGVRLHPTQLYEAFALAALFVLLVALGRRPTFPGQRALLYLALYSAWRFGVEFLRGDDVRGFLPGGLSVSQAIAVPTLAVAAILYARFRSRAVAAA